MSEYKINSGVSPVVGVILMVAVTVILAAVIGTFVLDLGTNTNENVNAGVSMDETNEGVEIQWIDRGNADQIEVLINGSKVSGSELTSVGNSVTITAEANKTVSVRASSEDTQTIIQSIQTKTSTIPVVSGTVSYNPPAEGVTVELLNSEGTVIGSDVTGTDGQYSIEGEGAEIKVNGYSTETGDVDLNTISSDSGDSIPTILMDGDGTTSNPYEVETASDLYAIREDLDGEYKLVNDIDASHSSTWNNGDGFKSIGESGSVFTGVIDGSGQTVTGITNTIDLQGESLVYYNKGTIKDINLTNIDLKNGAVLGGLVGWNNGTIDNVSVDGTITGDSPTVGGIAGSNIGIIKNSESSVTITNDNTQIGGIVGENGYTSFGTDFTGTLDNVSYDGTISGRNYVGGIAGENNNASEITNSTFKSSGSIEATNGSSIGGIYSETDSEGVLSGNTNNGVIK
jgi:flagellin-like protein